MKIYNISVNGKEYEVEVREKNASAQAVNVPSPIPKATATTDSGKAASEASVKRKNIQPQVDGGSSEKVLAPMPGKIMKVNSKKGDSVALNQVLCVLEAMKMENDITSPKAGFVEEVHIRDNDHVDTGDLMFLISD